MSYDVQEVKETMIMQSSLSLAAWQALEEIAHNAPNLFTEREHEFINAMVNESIKFDENIDIFIEELLADQIGLALMQAGIGKYINRD